MNHYLKWMVLCAALLSTHLTEAKTFETQSWVTHNGVSVVFYPAKEVPMLDISLAFAAGSAYDDAHFGLSALTTRLMNQGNKGIDAHQLAEKLETTGAQYAAVSTRDMAVFTLRTLTKPDSLTAATDAFALITSHPDFPEAAFVREKNQQIMGIKQELESPDEVANQAFFKSLYQAHPYAHPINGEPEQVNALSLQQVHDFYQRYFVAKNAILVLVGAIDTQTAHALSEKLTADLAEGKASLPIPQASPLQQETTIHIPFPSSQTMIRLGQLGITHQSPLYFPLFLGNYILGGGALVSDLAIELREKRGLTYGVVSQFSPMPGTGPFVISLSTRNAMEKTASQLTRSILLDFIKNGPTEAQVQDAKQYLIGAFPMALASNRNIADMLLKIRFYHLPDDYLNTYIQQINAVKVEQVKQAFQSTMTPKSLLEVTVGKK